jgi:hypothetical protein
MICARNDPTCMPIATTRDLGFGNRRGQCKPCHPEFPRGLLLDTGYGGPYESTRTEKTSECSRNLLGIRGLEAVQVSSHRGPPTDRPPDIPCNALGVLRGAPSRGRAPHASTGWLPLHTDLIARAAMRLPLQTMQLWGFAPSNNSVSIQLVPLTDREQSWKLARCGRSRVNGVHHVPYMCFVRMPSPKPGS